MMRVGLPAHGSAWRAASREERVGKGRLAGAALDAVLAKDFDLPDVGLADFRVDRVQRRLPDVGEGWWR